MNFDKQIKIGRFEISRDSEVFIIAEAGVNHNGDINLAKKLIDKASEAGVNAVKFQAFKTESLILENVSKANYQKRTGKAESQFQMLKKLELNKQQNIELKKYCDGKGIIFLTTPFDEDSLEELDDLNLSAYKISSTDTTNIPYLIKVAKKNKPIILSTGMSFLSEIKTALTEISKFNKAVLLLHCTSDYPVKDDEMNLNVLTLFQQKFNILTGYSDHSIYLGAAPYAVAMGAKVIEKHFTLDKSMPGPDHKASLSPIELKKLVTEIRRVEKFMGRSEKSPTASEIENRKMMQKCLVALCPIAKGELMSEKNIIAKRTGGIGISPIRFRSVFNHKARKDFEKNQIIEL